MPAAKVYAKRPVTTKRKSASPTSLTTNDHAHHYGSVTTLKHVNEVQVVGTGEVFLAPDRCRLSISVSSQKADVDEVKNSVTRRLDYISQVMHNHGVKVGSMTITDKSLFYL